MVMKEEEVTGQTHTYTENDARQASLREQGFCAAYVNSEHTEVCICQPSEHHHLPVSANDGPNHAVGDVVRTELAKGYEAREERIAAGTFAETTVDVVEAVVTAARALAKAAGPTMGGVDFQALYAPPDPTLVAMHEALAAYDSAADTALEWDGTIEIRCPACDGLPNTTHGGVGCTRPADSNTPGGAT